MCLVLWPSAQRPETNGQWLQSADNVDFVLPVLFIVAEQAMFMFTFAVLIEIMLNSCWDGRQCEQFDTSMFFMSYWPSCPFTARTYRVAMKLAAARPQNTLCAVLSNVSQNVLIRLANGERICLQAEAFSRNVMELAVCCMPTSDWPNAETNLPSRLSDSVRHSQHKRWGTIECDCPSLLIYRWVSQVIGT
jgi:hypothetical protein